MDNVSLAVFVCVLCLSGLATLGVANDYGPRATLAMGLGGVTLSAMLGAVAVTTGTPAIAAAAMSVTIVSVLAIGAVALNRWLPRW